MHVYIWGANPTSCAGHSSNAPGAIQVQIGEGGGGVSRALGGSGAFGHGCKGGLLLLPYKSGQLYGVCISNPV